MSQTADIVVDPAQVRFEEAGRDPLEVLTESERSEALRLITDGENATTAGEAALVIAGAFLLYREYMRRRLSKSMTPAITSTGLAVAADFYWAKFTPAWMMVVSSGLMAAAQGGVDARRGDVPTELTFALAEDYAKRLGPYVHTTTKQSLVEGFNTHVNRRVPPRLAADRAISSLGLSQRQMRALNAVKTPPPVNSPVDLGRERKTQEMIDRALVTRARALGEQEAFNVSQEAKQVGWLFYISKGKLTADAEKMWVTARDERVCKTCGPMHKVRVRIDQKFQTPLGEMWTPSLHPNCRCEMKLVAPVGDRAKELVKKDLFGRELHEFNSEHPRAGDGRFTTKTEEQTTRAPERAPARMPSRMPERAPSRVPTRMPSRIETTQRVEAPVQQRASTERAQLSRVEAARLVEALVRMRQEAPVRAVAQVAAPAKTKPEVRTVYSTIVPLKQSHYIVAMDQLDYGDGATARFNGEFAVPQGMDFDQQIEEVYQDRLDYEAEVIMSRGKNVLYVGGDPETLEGAERIELSKNEVVNILESELWGDPDGPTREQAHRWGFNRYEHMIDVFVIDKVDADETEGNVQAYEDEYGMEISGDYVIDDHGVMENYGFPIRFVYASPRGKPDIEL